METATHPGGILLATFTPLQGMTPLIMSFLETTHA
jgi:phage terminase large subunit-like protein